jgi:5-bromo-4-chloroindolyl phosphate hydrolysis protein
MWKSLEGQTSHNTAYQVLKSKVEIVKELHTTFYGMQEFYFKDCNGYILAFAERK